MAISGNGRFISSFVYSSDIDRAARIYEWKKHYLMNDAHRAQPFAKQISEVAYTTLRKFNRAGTMGVGNGYADSGDPSSHHAAYWTFDGTNWSRPTNLPIPQGVAKDKSQSDAMVINAEGDVIAGLFSPLPRNINSSYENHTPVVWRATDNNKTNWQITQLEELPLTNSQYDKQYEGIRAINAAGDLVAGASRGYATVWKFTNNQWNKPISLGIQGSIRATNGSGDLLGGHIQKNSDLFPVIWSGKDYSEVSYLKGDKGQEVQGEVTAISANSKIIAGNIIFNDQTRAAVWSPKNPNKAYILDLLFEYKKTFSLIDGISDDGTIAIGGQTLPYERPDGTNDLEGDSNQHLIAWVIKYNEDGSISSEALKKGSEIPDIQEITPIDLTFTQNALQTMASDSVKLLAMQHHGLWRLQQGCYTDEKGFCYSVRNDYSEYAGSKDFTTGLTLGYQFGNGFLVGFNLDHSLYRQLPNTFKRSHSNLGAGLFARWQRDNWYVAPALAWDFYDVKAKRPQLANTESEERTSRVKGFAASLTLGQDFDLQHQTKWGWYATLSHTNISRSGFSEQYVALPMSFKSMTLTETALALGLKLEMPVQDKLKFFAGLQLEQSLSSKAPIYQLESKLGKQQFEAKLNRTRGKLNVGLRYEVNPNFNVEFSPYVEQSIFDKKRYGATLNFNGRF